jgi:hypothetical protein
VEENMPRSWLKRMRPKALLRLEALLILFVTAQLCRAQQVNVRVINIDTGKEITGFKIVIGPEVNPEVARLDVVDIHTMSVKLETDRKGVATYEMIRPVPETLVLRVASKRWAECASLSSVSVLESLRSGVMQDNNCPSKAIKDRTYQAKPGEIVMFVRHISLLAKLEKWVANYFFEDEEDAPVE